MSVKENGHVRRLVVNADDLGISVQTNNAIHSSYRDGMLTSASLMANGPAFDAAIEQVVQSSPQLGIGVHLSLTSGRSVCGRNEVPLLVDDRSLFRHGFLSLWRLIRRQPQTALEQINREVRAQIARVIAAGVSIDHLNSHRHVHMLPGIIEVVASEAARHNVWMRWSHEPFSSRRIVRHIARRPNAFANVAKLVVLRFLPGVMSVCPRPDGPEGCFGILDSGHLDGESLANIMTCLPNGTSEVVTHPGDPTAEIHSDIAESDRQFHRSKRRRDEWSALIDAETISQFAKCNVEFTRFRDIPTTTVRSCTK
jgi:chitin disaccharide deacetylase